MQLSTILAALTAVAVSAGPITAPVASPVESLTTESPGVEVKVYPDGLPKELIPRAIESGLAKRANDGVYLCTDRNFGGYCVHIVAPYYQCGMWPYFLGIRGCAADANGWKIVGLGNDLNDLVSSLGPDAGYCFFFRSVPLCLFLKKKHLFFLLLTKRGEIIATSTAKITGTHTTISAPTPLASVTWLSTVSTTRSAATTAIPTRGLTIPYLGPNPWSLALPMDESF